MSSLTTGPESVLTAPGSPFEIAVEDVQGVPTKVFRHAPPSLLAIWEMTAAHGDKPFLVYEDERYSFAEARAVVAALATRLVVDYGIKPGDRVAIAMRNYPEWALAFWASVTAGAVVVPLNAWWTGPELAYGLADSGSVLLFADGERLERLAPHVTDTAVRQVVAVRAGDRLPAGADVFAAAAALAAVAALDAPGSSGAAPAVVVDPDSDATIMYTSGTTGKPKGAVGTHRNIGAFLMNMMYAGAAAAAAAPPPDPDQGVPGVPAMSTLLTFPLFHVGGLQSHLIPYTAFGGKLVLMYKWDPVQAVDLVEREGVTAFSGVPTTVFQLLDEAGKRGRDLTSLGGVASGATLVPPELVRRIDSQFQSRVSPANGYGLTETTGAAVANGGANYVSRPDSVGRPVSPVMEVRIADEAGEPASVGDIGEIWLKGPTVARGYFNNPEATAASFSDGWFHTGDLGRLDEDGFLYVVDRLKDVVIRGGENVYAAEVEAALYEHPEVIEAAIIGLPDESLGEQVAAVVRLRPGAGLTVEQLRSHVADRLAAFKVPSTVVFRDGELPRNAAGKVLKRELKEELVSAGKPRPAARGALAAAGIVVADLDRSAEFYAAVMGMRETQRFDVPAMHLQEVIMAFPGSPGAALVLMRYTDEAERAYVDIGGKLVFSVDDPAAVVERARAAGGQVLREAEPSPGFGVVGFVTDLDGYALEVLALPERPRT